MAVNSNELYLKECLIKPSVSIKSLLIAIDACMTDSECTVPFASLDEAFKNIIAKNFPKNGHLEEGDKVRERLSLLLYGIPLKNLRRKEERILSEDPIESAAFDKPIQSGQDSIQGKILQPIHKPQVNVPVTVQRFAKPDREAFDDYVGNTEAVRTVELQVDGALMRGDPIRPMLLRGPSGCGKTELGLRIARRLGNPFYYVSGSTLKAAEDVDVLFDSVEDGSVLFIDEIQASGDKAKTRILTKQSKGEGNGGKEVTFIFATNLSGKLPDAFRNRCVELKLRDYNINELIQISNLTAKENGLEFEDGVAKYISERCHGIARYAVDYTHDIIVENAATQRVITLQHAKEFFERRGIDSLGLCNEHRQYIAQLERLGQASAHSLAASLGENDVAEIERTIEPLLLKHGLITISSRGRCLTDDGKIYAKHLDKAV